MKTFALVLALALSPVAAFAQQPPPREEWYRGLELEDAAGNAELIVVARVEEVTEIRVVRGGKGESATQQFRFKPLRVVKGVFARPELILGSADLGGYRISGALRTVKAGQTRLLFLGRSDVGYRNSNERDGLDWSLPPRDAADRCAHENLRPRRRAPAHGVPHARAARRAESRRRPRDHAP